MCSWESLVHSQRATLCYIPEDKTVYTRKLFPYKFNSYCGSWNFSDKVFQRHIGKD
jgi:hypothetical protein